MMPLKALAELLRGLEAPALVLDLDQLRANIAAVRERLPAGCAVRIADKSLPCLPLLALAAEGLGTHRFMSFHLPITTAVLREFPAATVLMGKPMPASAVSVFLAAHRDLAPRVVWLVDTPERQAALAEIARARNLRLKIAYEVNVGLNRGGFATPEALRAAHSALPGSLICEGLMGYEAHVWKLPKWLGRGPRAEALALRRLAEFARALPEDARSIVNTAGSSTVLALGGPGLANDVTIGSALVMPSDFEQPHNAALKPALFIATPVLKRGPHDLAGFRLLSSLMHSLLRLPREVAFLYGGKWMARPAWPEGLAQSRIFGLSSNQQAVTLPEGSDLAPDDIVLLRPTQSEAVLTALPRILLVENGKLAGEWLPLPIL